MPSRGDRVLVPICHHIDPLGVAVDYGWDPHFAWPQVLVLHDGPGATHPRLGPSSGRRRRLYWWPVYSVRRLPGPSASPR